jgi:hypothetical protein
VFAPGNECVNQLKYEQGLPSGILKKKKMQQAEPKRFREKLRIKLAKIIVWPEFCSTSTSDG